MGDVYINLATELALHAMEEFKQSMDSSNITRMQVLLCNELMPHTVDIDNNITKPIPAKKPEVQSSSSSSGSGAAQQQAQVIPHKTQLGSHWLQRVLIDLEQPDLWRQMYQNYGVNTAPPGHLAGPWKTLAMKQAAEKNKLQASQIEEIHRWNWMRREISDTSSQAHDAMYWKVAKQRNLLLFKMSKQWCELNNQQAVKNGNYQQLGNLEANR